MPKVFVKTVQHYPIARADKPIFEKEAEVCDAKQISRKRVVALVTKPARSPLIVLHAGKAIKEYSIPD